MNSSIISILELLSNSKTLTSAGFSAGYSFEESDAEGFFTDLSLNLTNAYSIFLGILIFEESEKGVYTVVDGLQRVITISLLLCALCECFKNTSVKNDEARKKIMLRYLLHLGEPKLELLGKDRDIYRKILFSEPLDLEEQQNSLYKVFELFISKIRERVIPATALFKLILKIQFMVVITDKSQVEARELYQSLNAAKDDFSQINLITSFISQYCKEASAKWVDIIEYYKANNVFLSIKNFVKDFLTAQNNGKVIAESQLYVSFKNYYKQISQYQSAEQIIDHVCRYAKFYLKILRADFEDYDIQKQFVSINENNGQDSYPYLMEVLDDLENSHIDKGMFVDILTMINTFVVERNQDGSDMKMNFASLSCDINKKLAMKEYDQVSADENVVTINQISQNSDF